MVKDRFIRMLYLMSVMSASMLYGSVAYAEGGGNDRAQMLVPIHEWNRTPADINVSSQPSETDIAAPIPPKRPKGLDAVVAEDVDKKQAENSSTVAAQAPQLKETSPPQPREMGTPEIKPSVPVKQLASPSAPPFVLPPTNQLRGNMGMNGSLLVSEKPLVGAAPVINANGFKRVPREEKQEVVEQLSQEKPEKTTTLFAPYPPERPRDAQVQTAEAAGTLDGQGRSAVALRASLQQPQVQAEAPQVVASANIPANPEGAKQSIMPPNEIDVAVPLPPQRPAGFEDTNVQSDVVAANQPAPVAQSKNGSPNFFERLFNSPPSSVGEPETDNVAPRQRRMSKLNHIIGDDPDRAASLRSLISKHAAANGIPYKFAEAVVRVESRYNPRARNGPYIGLMQIHPRTAQSLGYGGDASGLFDPDTNLQYGIKYLAMAYKLAGGDTCGTIMRYQGGHRAVSMTSANRKYCSKVKMIFSENLH
ncbi:transglycosylase SLT domain-containing protein [Microvirga sp. W0021]|uniref:Transglycosylase SLT domain-containing protein n=1 Tax=Hohaiivirga grylli TaxID=3133970 RepID=A0ABV0BP42_9HYPH